MSAKETPCSAQQQCKIEINDINGITYNGSWKYCSVVSVKNEDKQCEFGDCKYRGNVVLHIKSMSRTIYLCYEHAKDCCSSGFMNCFCEDERKAVGEIFNVNKKWTYACPFRSKTDHILSCVDYVQEHQMGGMSTGGASCRVTDDDSSVANNDGGVTSDSNEVGGNSSQGGNGGENSDAGGADERGMPKVTNDDGAGEKEDDTLPSDCDESQAADGVTPTEPPAVSTPTTSATSGGPALNSREKLAEDPASNEVGSKQSQRQSSNNLTFEDNNGGDGNPASKEAGGSKQSQDGKGGHNSSDVEDEELSSLVHPPPFDKCEYMRAIDGNCELDTRMQSCVLCNENYHEKCREQMQKHMVRVGNPNRYTKSQLPVCYECHPSNNSESQMFDDWDELYLKARDLLALGASLSDALTNNKLQEFLRKWNGAYGHLRTIFPGMRMGDEITIPVTFDNQCVNKWCVLDIFAGRSDGSCGVRKQMLKIAGVCWNRSYSHHREHLSSLVTGAFEFILNGVAPVSELTTDTTSNDVNATGGKQNEPRKKVKLQTESKKKKTVPSQTQEKIICLCCNEEFLHPFPSFVVGGTLNRTVNPLIRCSDTTEKAAEEWS